VGSMRTAALTACLDGQHLAELLRTICGPIVLVGGAVITNAATGNPSVRALVYVDAFAQPQSVSEGRDHQ
jgi:hypothetical protein